MVVFSFENRSEERVGNGSNIPCSVDEEALINSMQVPNS
jgi:hypothetical protein